MNRGTLERTTDYLNLKFNSKIRSMLAKHGDNEPKQEEVILSMNVTKINRKSKKQQRVLLLTDKALYNIRPNDLKKFRRRIDLTNVTGIACVEGSKTFAVHVPSEYDYHFESERRRRIVQTICVVYQKRLHKKLVVTGLPEEQMEQVLIRKDETKKSNAPPEEKLQQWQRLLDDEKTKLSPYDFEDLELIGRGGFGKVIRVRKKDTGEIFAMKELKKIDIIQQKQVRNTKAERLILKKTTHPFLMHLRYAFQTESKLYLILDFYKGGELYFHIARVQHFSEEQARFIVAELALALSHLHSIHMVYRDLKPENVLFDEKGHICLTDFGLAKELEQRERFRTNSFCGTPAYIAPEVITEKGYSFAVDWWALGNILYELVFGGPPFLKKTQDMEEVLKAVAYSPLKIPAQPKISKDCRDCIKGLLRKDPNKRLCAQNGISDLKKHPFFATIDWDKLYKKELEPPYKPQVKNELDCVATEFTDQSLRETPVEVPGKLYRDQFKNFTYDGRETVYKT